MDLLLTRLFELFFLPPGLFIFLLLLSILLVKNIQRLKRLLFLQAFLIYFISIPLSNHYLFSLLETSPELTREQIDTHNVDVIVVLAGGIKPYRKEYQGADVGDFTQLRLRYAAWLQKQTGLPMLVTGGIEKASVTEAELMRKVLIEEYHIKAPILLETASQNTYENALYSRTILADNSWHSMYLVTSAFHMPRALKAFRNHAKQVIPAPMGFYHNSMDFQLSDFLPNSKSLRQNYLALHELIGFYWYQLRYS